MARKGIKHLKEKGLIKELSFHHTQYIYTAAKEIKVEKVEVLETAKQAGKARGKQQKAEKQEKEG